jgi:transcriptional regulator with XRE-family HTH domain
MEKIDSIEIEFGDAIRRARIRKGYPLEDVAAMANLSSNSVRSLELGRGTTLSTLVKVLRVLDEIQLLTNWIELNHEFSPIVALRQSQRRIGIPQRVPRNAQKIRR